MSLTQLTDQVCPECQSLLDLMVVPPEEPKPVEPGQGRPRRDTPHLTRLLVCPECGWTGPG